MRALVVINPVAGPGRSRTIGACVDLAQSVLSAHNYAPDVRVTSGPEDAYRLSCEAAASNVDLVIAWGGDGTVNGAASAIAGTGIPLAIVPGGSGNGLARDLLIPFNPTAAFTVAARGATRAIDGGELHGSLFFNVAGVGFDARIAARLAQPGARRGLVGYIFATVGELRGYQPGRYSIDQVYDVDGKPLVADIIDRPALLIALANSRQYGSGAQIAPRALLDDGMMEVVIVEPQSGFSIMRQVPAFFRGTLKEGPGLLMRSAASMEISCEQPIYFHVDGEPRNGPNRIALRTRRGILAIRVNG
jgi:YegS/Rv2252/BmrU family lipid kinase